MAHQTTECPAASRLGFHRVLKTPTDLNKRESNSKSGKGALSGAGTLLVRRQIAAGTDRRIFPASARRQTTRRSTQRSRRVSTAPLQYYRRAKNHGGGCVSQTPCDFGAAAHPRPVAIPEAPSANPHASCKALCPGATTSNDPQQ